MINLDSSSGFEKTTKFFQNILKGSQIRIAEKYAEEGLKALQTMTPKATGKTAASWNYEIKRSGGKVIINYYNTNVVKGENIALLIQMGHGTKTGGYVQGRDYINPALQPVFSSLAEAAWKEMSSLAND